jgi:hypothetical protein
MLGLALGRCLCEGEDEEDEDEDEGSAASLLVDVGRDGSGCSFIGGGEEDMCCLFCCW